MLGAVITSRDYLAESQNRRTKSSFLIFLRWGAVDFFLLITNELQNILKISENKFGRIKLWYYLWRIN